MNKETLDRAIELKENIEYLELCLNTASAFGVTSWYCEQISNKNKEFPSKLNNDIRNVIQKHLEMYKKELEEL